MDKTNVDKQNMKQIIHYTENKQSCSRVMISYFKNNKKPKLLENSQLLRKTWHVNQIFELILEQCVANYYADNTIAK